LEPKNLLTKRPYNGINRWATALQGKPSPYWLTFSQCSKLGGKVKKGAKHAKVVWYALIEKKRKLPDGTEEVANRFYAPVKYHRVFNYSDTEGIDLSEVSGIAAAKDMEGFDSIEACEDVISSYADAPKVKHRKGGDPSYSRVKDEVVMPQPTDFDGEEDYYSTIFHEYALSTGHSSRLDRKSSAESSEAGDTSFGKEALVAELSAAILCHKCNIDPKTIDNSAAYLKGWLKALRAEPKMLLQSAQLAEKAVKHIVPVKENDND
jgi:antirestriction protein ArdC